MDNKQYYVKLPVWKKCAFGSIDTANNFSWSYISSFLAIYLTDTFLIPASYVSIMFLVCRFWDAINDPIVGYLADRTRTRWGRYRPWIFFGTAPLFITTALLFWPAPRLGAPDQDGLRLRPLRAGGALLHDGQPDLRLPQRGRHAGPGGARVAGLLPAALCLHRLHGDDPAGRARGARPLQQKPRHGLLLPGRHLCRLLHPHADLRREGAEGGHPALQHGRQDVHLQAAAALL